MAAIRKRAAIAKNRAERFRLAFFAELGLVVSPSALDWMLAAVDTLTVVPS
jgi:hypothetical protein